MPSDRAYRVTYAIWFGGIVLILLFSLGESIYHAGWMDGFHKCAAIYEEADHAR